MTTGVVSRNAVSEHTHACWLDFTHCLFRWAGQVAMSCRVSVTISEGAWNCFPYTPNQVGPDAVKGVCEPNPVSLLHFYHSSLI